VGFVVDKVAIREGFLSVLNSKDRTMTQAVSRRPLTVVAQVRVCGICGGQSGNKRGFSISFKFERPYNDSGCQSAPSNRSGPGQGMWDLW